MASFFTRTLDKLTPWRRGGEIQRDQEAYNKKKKREEERQRQSLNVRSTQAPFTSNQEPQIKPQQPVNIFETLNKNLVFNKPQNAVPVVKDQNVTSLDIPQPGTIVKPNIRQQQAIEEGKRANELVKQNTASNVSGFQKFKNNVLPAAGDAAYSFFARPIKAVVTNPIESGRELLAQATKNKAAEKAARQRNTQNLYNKEAVEKINRGERPSWLDFGTSAADTLSVLPIAKSLKIANVGAKEAIATKSLKPFLKGTAEAVDEALLGIRNLFKKPSIVKDVGGVIENIPRPITVEKNIPVTNIGGLPESVNIRNLNEPGRLIQEFPGDASIATPDPLIQKLADDARAESLGNAAFDANKTAPRPNPAIEGMLPGETSTSTYKLTETAVKSSQDKLIDEYADILKQTGEGNGVSITPDGRRVSNNVRSAENKGKRMTSAAWRDEAESQLRAGKGEPGIQKAFDDSNNPEVQSLLNKGEQPPTPTGRPIQVKQVNGIDVVDNTNVPQNLPETPGKVRVTKATAPNNAKSEVVAAELPPMNGVLKDGKFTPSSTTPSTPKEAAESLPRTGETDETFLKRTATDMQSNIKRAVDSLKATKKMTKAQRAQQAAAGQKAYDEAKLAGKSIAEQEADRATAMRGGFDRQDYVGTPVHSEDEQRLRDMVDEHYKDMPYQAGNVRKAFTKLFHAGEPGWASEAGNHIIPSDIKNIRKFLNESVPNPDGNGGLGDFAESALKELSEADAGPGKIANAIGLQRAIRFTADISATGRQALPGASSHPIEFAKAAKKSFQVMFSHDKYQKFVNELASNKEANYINDRMGAYLSVLNDDINKADDIYRNSAWAHKIPGVKQVVAASERQYNTILSMMRYYSGKRFIDTAGGIGNLEKIASESGDAKGFLKAIGTVSNVNTGRGFGRALDTGASKVLSDVLVSPRGLAAKLQRFNPKYYTDLFKANPAAGKEALRSLGIQTALTASALGAASKAGIYEDGQIKVGNTRYDLTGGAANIIRTAVRVAQYIHGDRETTPFNSAETEVTKWARNQLAPFVSSSLNAIGIHQDKTGTWVNHWGEDVTLASTALENFTPVNAEQVASDRQLGTSGTQTAVNAGLNTLGFGVNTFQNAEDKQISKVGKNVYKQLKDTAKQLEKDGISTNNEDIGNYVSDGEYDKAARAKEYQLMEIKADPNASPTKIKKAETALEEINLRKEGVPIDDDEIQSTVEEGDYDTALQGLNHKLSSLEGKSDAKRKPVETDIKRLEITRDGKFDPSIIKLYQSMSNSEWRKMGDPDSEDHDADMYQELWAYDEAMAKAGVSRSDFKPDKQKYSAKKSGSGRGGKGSKQLDTSFGTLKAGQFAPQVKQYQTIDTKSGSIPHISVQRPNIVHKITSSG